MTIQQVPTNPLAAQIPQENEIRVQQQDPVITTTVLNILRKNPNIHNADLGSIIRANFPVDYYNAVRIQVHQESFEFPGATRALNARVLTIIPIDPSEGLFSSLYTTIFLGTKFEDYIYNGPAMGPCILGIQGSEESFEECAKALENKRPIIIRVADNHIYCEVAPDSPPLCTIS